MPHKYPSYEINTYRTDIRNRDKCIYVTMTMIDNVVQAIEIEMEKRIEIERSNPLGKIRVHYAVHSV